MKIEEIERSETSSYIIQTPGNYPKENIIYSEHGESLKSKNVIEPHGAQLTLRIVRRMLFPCWIIKASDIHSEYVYTLSHNDGLSYFFVGVFVVNGE